ncbi:MAG: phospholipase D-like domain-containing protein, partial [Acidobacteriota bacterium]
QAPGRRPILSLSPKWPIAAAEAKPQTVRTLSSYEHAPILENALTSAARRLLIVSPWIRHQVVNEEFLKKLSDCLERNVDVTIAFGFGRVDRGERAEDIEARKALEALSLTFKKFKLIRKSNIHAKILLVDDRYFVTTSFNWLSFRGDPNQPLREEEGTLVEGSELVNEYFERLQSRLVAS